MLEVEQSVIAFLVHCCLFWAPSDIPGVGHGVWMIQMNQKEKVFHSIIKGRAIYYPGHLKCLISYSLIYNNSHYCSHLISNKKDHFPIHVKRGMESWRELTIWLWQPQPLFTGFYSSCHLSSTSHNQILKLL